MKFKKVVLIASINCALTTPGRAIEPQCKLELCVQLQARLDKIAEINNTSPKPTSDDGKVDRFNQCVPWAVVGDLLRRRLAQKPPPGEGEVDAILRFIAATQEYDGPNNQIKAIYGTRKHPGDYLTRMDFYKQRLQRLSEAERKIVVDRIEKYEEFLKHGND
ncbi:MAG: hypothetical protein C5B49_13525 [Bdellovibrio sp.]|nr:MAG: hypothetical protein C5B49_13525 [Bdellovibrio sp.]